VLSSFELSNFIITCKYLPISRAYLSNYLNIIFVADIFGRTEEFKALCQQITSNIEQVLNLKNSVNVECHLIGPYQKQPKLFNSEQDAYQYFTKTVTLQGYVKHLKTELSKISGINFLVGFSVGGSAVWQLCAENTAKQNVLATCFYSSQIRHMMQLTPNIETRLILPISEEHFSVAEMCSVLQKKPNITIEQSRKLHGFMNALSPNYDSNAYQHYIKRLTDLLSIKYNQFITEQSSTSTAAK
jgi:hypothetical protein|tara:strand:- start:8013 stop:8741 length:729 start_codon:yes stop_codon:yes gene_type:complete